MAASVFRASRALSSAKPSAMMDTFSNWYIKASGYREYGTSLRTSGLGTMVMCPRSVSERSQAPSPPSRPRLRSRPRLATELGAEMIVCDDRSLHRQSTKEASGELGSEGGPGVSSWAQCNTLLGFPPSNNRLPCASLWVL